MSKLNELRSYGQSFWLDFLSRELLEDKNLKKSIKKKGLSGLVSNPAVLKKAIESSSAYDKIISRSIGKVQSPEDLYRDVLVADAWQACDLLAPVYRQTDGHDGYVSLQVSPHFAQDALATMRQAQQLWNMVGRPNLLIKVPGTRECMPVIEELLYRGINVNITLLFSLEAYWDAFHAYVHALERRLQEGLALKPDCAVASFFLSRVDVAVDNLLKHRISKQADAQLHDQVSQLLGQTAIANARLAYASFRALIASERWLRLEKHGARPQRIVWASTETKNPAYSDVNYIEPLIGPYTVSTMSEKTAEAFDDHGVVTASIQQDRKKAREIMETLEKLGIYFEVLTRQMVDMDVQKNIELYDQTIELLSDRIKSGHDTRERSQMNLSAAGR